MPRRATDPAGIRSQDKRRPTSIDMDSNKTNPPAPGSAQVRRSNAAKPEWADGLRQLYDSVVDEPLPDTFRDLLAKLDAKG
jgi:hypothetical protein